MAVRKTYTVSYEGGLNLREKPSKDSNILAVLPHGEKVTIDTAKDVPEGWTAVKSGGFVMKEFLK